MEGRVIVGGYQHVVHVDYEPSFPEFFFEEGIHHHLEGGWRVSEAEEHHSRFEKAFVSNKCCLPFIAIFYSDVIVTPSNIELSEEGSCANFIDELGNNGQGIHVTECPLV